MRRRKFHPFLIALGALAARPRRRAAARRPAPAPAEFRVEPIAERTWRGFPRGRCTGGSRLSEPRGGAGRGGAAGAGGRACGRAWLFTLGAAGGATPGGRGSRRSGRYRSCRPRRYLLRVNRAGGPPGAMTPVHSHAGSEAFYVLAGALSQRTAHGIVRIEAGQAMNGHGAGMAMQLTSSGRSRSTSSSCSSSTRTGPSPHPPPSNEAPW